MHKIKANVNTQAGSNVKLTLKVSSKELRAVPEFQSSYSKDMMPFVS